MYITFGHMLEVGIHRLEEAKIADAKRDAETLLLYLEKADRTFLYIHRNDATDEYRADAYFGLIGELQGNRCSIFWEVRNLWG